MSDPFRLRPPGSELGWQRPSLFGDQFQLRLDPQIEAEMNALRWRMELERLQLAWLHPNWLDLHRLSIGQDTPTLTLSPFRIPPSAVPAGAPPWMRYQPPPQPAPLVPRGAGPSEPRAGEIGDLLGAIWKVPAVQAAATRVTDQLTDDFWRNRTTGERVMIVTWGTMIAGTTLAGVLGNRQSRIWALDKINGRDLSVPGVDGLSFRLYTDEGTVTGGGATIGFGRGVTVSGDYSRPHEVPGGATIQDHRFTVQLNLLEAIPALRGTF